MTPPPPSQPPPPPASFFQKISNFFHQKPAKKIYRSVLLIIMLYLVGKMNDSDNHLSGLLNTVIRENVCQNSSSSHLK